MYKTWMKNLLWLEVSAAGGRTPWSSTFSDAFSPHSPSCSCPSPDWLPFLDWNFLNEHLLQDLQISCCLAKMHCPRYAHGPSSLILKISVQISPCSQALPKYTRKTILPFDFLHQTSFFLFFIPLATIWHAIWFLLDYILSPKWDLRSFFFSAPCIPCNDNIETLSLFNLYF